MTIYDESHKELIEFVKWFNHFHHADPMIIGGWAVYHYNPYFESKDVDVVFDIPPYTKDQQLRQYFGTHGYELLPRDSFDVNARAGMVTGETFRKKYEKEFIDIDACSTTDENRFVRQAYHDKQVPFSKVKTETVKVNLPETSYTYRVPTIELLLLYKIKAYNDRDELLKQAQTQDLIQWLTSKRDKDGSDIIALLDKKHCIQPVNFDKLNQMIDEFGIRQVVRETLFQAFNNPISMNLYKKLYSDQIREDLYNRVIIQKLLFATKEEISSFIQDLSNDYKIRVENLPTKNQNRFPMHGYPMKITAAATRNMIYIFFSREGTRNNLNVQTIKENPALEEVMDDLREGKEVDEVIALVEIQKPIYTIQIPNNSSLLEKRSAEHWANQLYEHFYRLVSTNKETKRPLWQKSG